MNERSFSVTPKKPSFSQWHIQLDIATWLDGDTISNVDFGAIDKATGESIYDPDTDTDEILDQTKCIFTAEGLIKPYVEGGVSGKTYKIEMKVTTTIGDKEIFWITIPIL
jgi:hypothetical protein